MNLEQLVRDNIFELHPYSSARNEFKGEASVFLDANENPLNSPYNRYPDPLQKELKKKIGEIKKVSPDCIFLGNGSDEPIDLVIRIFCEPRHDNIVAISPTYGMYEVCADINDIEYRKVLLNTDYSLNANSVLAATDSKTKIIFLCSPNNPTANLLEKEQMIKIITEFKGIVVVDEAYIDFSADESLLPQLSEYPNVIILQTLSKAWGMAAIRLGMAFASPEIIEFFNKVKYPYNINQLTQEFVLRELEKSDTMKEWVANLLEQRNYLEEEFKKITFIEKIHPSDANFILIKVGDANRIYSNLVDKGIIVRNRNSISLCNGCLRITVGTEQENRILVQALKELK